MAVFLKGVKQPFSGIFLKRVEMVLVTPVMEEGLPASHGQEAERLYVLQCLLLSRSRRTISCPTDIHMLPLTSLNMKNSLIMI